MQAMKRTQRVQAFLNTTKTVSKELDNQLFARMYTTAVEQVVDGNTTLFEFLNQLEHMPVDIETFLDSPEFLGATDLVMWPEVRKAIIEENQNWWKGLDSAPGAIGGAYDTACLMGCVDHLTEFLTPTGWKLISEYQAGDLVGQYTRAGKVEFVRPSAYIKRPGTTFYKVKTRGGIDMVISPDHRVMYQAKGSDTISECTGAELADRHWQTVQGFPGRFLTTFEVDGRPGIDLTDAQIRVMVMVAADGTFRSDVPSSRSCIVTVKKERKKQRIRQLLSAAGISYSVQSTVREGYAKFQFDAPERNKSFRGWWSMTTEQLRVVADEVLHWDGSAEHAQFYTRDRHSADFIQYAYSATGTRATMQWQDRGGSRSREYRVKACKMSTRTLSQSGPDSVQRVEDWGDGFQYCFEVPSSMLIMRRGGQIAVTGNCTRSGKSTQAIVGFMYHLHILLCMKNPQGWYGLPSATSIVMAIMGAKPHVTKKVVYAPMKKYVERMPWFQKYGLPDKNIDSEMLFIEKNVRVVPVGGNEDAVLGEALIACLIDEINFMNVVQKSKKAEVSMGRSGVYDQAAMVYDTVVRRRRGTFPKRYPQIGMIYASSSTRYKGDFTDKLKAETDRFGHTNVYIFNKKQYEVQPASNYCGETFRLLIGNDIQHDTRILKDGEEVPPGAWVEDVPIEYKPDFERKPYDALRDVLGISSNAISPFIKMRYKVYECVEFGQEKQLESFLEKDHVILGVDGMPRVKQGHYCYNPGKPRYVHIDLSRTGDRCGIAMLRVDGMGTFERAGGQQEMMPMVTVELACSISPDANNEIQIAEVRAWVRSLITVHKYPVRGVSYDGFDSRESIQQWRKDRMPSRDLSVDRSSAPYKQFRDALYDRRIALPDDAILLSEILDLEYDTDKDKIDHPMTGSKDVSDAVCGAYANLLDRRSTWNSSVELGDNSDMDGRYDGERFDDERRH